jgi:putative transcriptional regulator
VTARPHLGSHLSPQIFRCRECDETFSETRETVFFDLRTPEEKVMMTLKMLLVGVDLSGIAFVLGVTEQTTLDWLARAAAKADEINAAALSDPDNPPRTPEREKHLKRVPRVKVMRRALHLTQEEFAARFRIPLGTLRDWEQGKTEPDQAARAYLTVIARNPKAVTDALNTAP